MAMGRVTRHQEQSLLQFSDVNRSSQGAWSPSVLPTRSAPDLPTNSPAGQADDCTATSSSAEKSAPTRRPAGRHRCRIPPSRQRLI